MIPRARKQKMVWQKVVYPSQKLHDENILKQTYYLKQ